MSVENQDTIIVNKEEIVLSEEDNAQVDELYRTLGQLYYEGDFKETAPELELLCENIAEIFKRYEKKNLVCKKCGAELEEDAHFCSECGMPIAEDEAVIEPAAQKELVCKYCGKLLNPAAKFCGACGKRVE